MLLSNLFSQCIWVERQPVCCCLRMLMIPGSFSSCPQPLHLFGFGQGQQPTKTIQYILGRPVFGQAAIFCWIFRGVWTWPIECVSWAATPANWTVSCRRILVSSVSEIFGSSSRKNYPTFFISFSNGRGMELICELMQGTFDFC